MAVGPFGSSGLGGRGPRPRLSSPVAGPEVPGCPVRTGCESPEAWNSPTSNESRRFTEKEFALVLRKAISLQDQAPRQSGLPSQGMTLEDMKALAHEVGIDPALVDHAVALLPKEESTLQDRNPGGPTR